jgi:hypothetical protein
LDSYDHLLRFVSIWEFSSGFGIMYEEKSGNPASQRSPLHVANFFFFKPKNPDLTEILLAQEILQSRTKKCLPAKKTGADSIK